MLAVDNGLSVVEEMLLEDTEADPVLLAKCHNKCPYVLGPMAMEQRVFFVHVF